MLRCGAMIETRTEAPAFPPPVDPTLPRLYAIVARQARMAVVFRRGPSRWTRLLAWDLANDTITPGQWIKARVYERRCDLSPDGEMLAAFIARHKPPLGTWTTLSRPPYFTALALWPKGDAWGGGGLFESDRRFGLNHGSTALQPPGVRKREPTPAHPSARRDRHGRKIIDARESAKARAARKARRKSERVEASPVSQLQETDAATPMPGFETPPWLHVGPLADWSGRGEDDPILSTRLIRDGWSVPPHRGETVRGPASWTFTDPPTRRKPLAKNVVLAVTLRGVHESNGRWMVETGAIEDAARKRIRDLGRVDFLDADHNGDALYGADGALWRLPLDALHAEPKLVADLRAMTPEPFAPPDWALLWPKR